VWERDGGQCTFVSEAGQRCPARMRLEFDHVDPVACGGQATVDGIRIRCRAHNQYTAECAFGVGFMETKREEARQARAQAAAARAQAAEERARAAAEAREAAAAERARAAAEARARAERENDPDRSVVPWLRGLGFRLQEAREAAAHCDDMPGASIEERIRAALRHVPLKTVPPGRAA
jgi:hypothetical protein